MEGDLKRGMVSTNFEMLLRNVGKLDWGDYYQEQQIMNAARARNEGVISLERIVNFCREQSAILG